MARADRVLPGLWRLRLPLPWPGVPHGNAYAVAAGDGVVLVDTGLHEPGRCASSSSRWTRPACAWSTCASWSAHTRTPITMARPPRSWSAPARELWMHPNHEHMTKAAEDPERAFERRFEIARQSGVPADALAAYKQARGAHKFGIAEIVMPDRELSRAWRSRRTSAAGRCTRPRSRAVARGAPPARARAAAVGRPPARACLALLRLRVLAGPGGRVPVEPRRGGRARCPARARRPRPPGTGRARSRRGEQARGRGAHRAHPSLARRRSPHSLRHRPRDARRGAAGTDDDRLGPQRGALLSEPHGAGRRGRAPRRRGSRTLAARGRP